jgi:Protein of unknown function (DUF3551)
MAKLFGPAGRAGAVMKVTVVSIFMFGGSIVAAHAQGAPWCLQSDAFEGDRSCSYATFQQCLIDRNYLNGFCVQNSTYRSPAYRRSFRKASR